ncbi:thiamine pyrophosphate-requiring protein [Microbacterium marinilacus]|uniref:Thiamine pyrophosphate-requiring protein n=1 Tax=Microbacterium marinilacus TaxID=415209 RepID=A0ABP7BKY7_9MICO|nr:thiamine pyrophosphate-requiring protein [Microbacterium marinilacus]MBY0689752.1 thiamine pyrophosphate-requiring protein [Microbacterium marinilacus]
MAPVDDDRLNAAELFLRALEAHGVTHLFANLGSDHPAFIEALAARHEAGVTRPAVILCPHEFTALSAAHGMALATGAPQAVLVHNDVGTANLGGSVHNAARAEVPVLIFAGLTPYTTDGELPGSRNAPVNFKQDVPDQHALVRPYAKWMYDLRTAQHTERVVHRALQIARSAPAGPVYVTGAREVLAETAPYRALDPGHWAPVAPSAADAASLERIVADLLSAERPLVVTSHLGRDTDAVRLLVELAERLVLPVVEPSSSNLSFPATHPLHAGYAFDDVVADADVVLVLDSDVPWVHTRHRPADDARVHYVDADPLKSQLPFWNMPAQHVVGADGATVLRQLLDATAARPLAFPERERREQRAARLRARRDADARAALDAAPGLTPARVAAIVSDELDDDVIVLNETITANDTVHVHVPRIHPGTRYGNRGTSLGWIGGGAIGIALAHPGRRIVALVGDGTYQLSVPSSTYWVAQRYRTPFVTVILDNGGWNATKQSLQGQFAGGVADTSDRYWVNLGQHTDLAGIASAAGGAWGAVVTEVEQLAPALREALAQVERGRAAVIDVRMPAITAQAD